MPRETGVTLPPLWVMLAASTLIVFHFFCALITALFASSGPWPAPMGSMEALPPQFAITMGRSVAEPYQHILKTNSPFRFISIKQEQIDIAFEAVMRDANGTVKSKHVWPDPDAPEAIRYRQRLLAQQLGNDIPLPPQESIIIAPGGEKLRTVRWWHPEGDHRMILKQDSPNAVPRNQTFMQPGDWQFIVAKSYTRYLSRVHPETKVEIIRTWCEPVQPMVLIEEAVPSAELLKRFHSSYGELPK